MKRCFAILLIAVLLLPLSLFPTSASSLSDVNKYNFFTSHCGFPNASGVNTYSECYQTSDYIPVKAGDTVTAGPFRDGQIIYVTVYKSDKRSVVKQIYNISELSAVGELNGAGYLKSYKIPANGAYVRVTLGAEYYNTFFVTVNKAFTAAEYTAEIAAQGLTAYLDFARASKSEYAGKSLLAVGDSVGHGSYEKNYEGATKAAVKIAFAGRMKNLLGFGSYANYAAGGATFSNKHSSRILNQIKNNANSKTEYLLIEGGMVDLFAYQHTVVPCGYLSDSFDPSTFAPENTFIGGLERSLYAATTQAPNAVIAFLIPYSVKVSTGGRFGWERLFQYIPIVCEKWGVPVIDLYHNDTVNEVMSYVKTGGPNLIFWDNLHCAPHTYTACSLEAAMEFYQLPKYNVNNRKKPTNIPANIAKATWETPNPGNPAVQINLAENLYTGKNTTNFTSTASYKTSDYIAVEPGDIITFGPCSPYCPRLIQGFTSTKANYTGTLDIMSAELVSVLTTGQLILQYKVPSSVFYIKVSFQASAAPVVTKNLTFDTADYVGWLKSALAGQKPVIGTSTVTTAASPVTTKAPVTTRTPVSTNAPITTAAPETTAAPATEAPSTTAPVTTAPVTTVPVTTAPKTTAAEITTAAGTSSAPDSATAKPSETQAPDTTASPDTTGTGTADTSSSPDKEPAAVGCSAAVVHFGILPLLAGFFLCKRKKHS